MKTKLLNTLSAATLLLMPIINFGQAPTLGTTANFALFTTVGEVKNVGITYITHITGNCGSNNGPVNGFGNVDGIMTHTSDPLSMQAETDLLVAHGMLNNTTPTDNTLSPLIGTGPGQVLTAGVYSITNASITLDQNLILDAEGDASKVFIFQLQGAFSTNANSKVKLINGALACNVFWKIDGLVDMAAGTSMKGTIIATAAINMGVLDTLEGRALSIGGAITVSNTLVYKPTGCGSPTLTGPITPVLASTACYALFSSSGQVTNTGITHITGDIGTNGTTDSATGYNPSFVTGTIHHYADASTATCEVDLLNAYTYLNTLPVDIELLYPAELGHNLILTPHTYLLGAATSLTDTLYLNAKGNANAIFVIQISGAFSTSTHSQILLTNGAQAKNIFWKIDGATSINDSSVFIGTIVCNGAIDIGKGVAIDGRALTNIGDLTTDAITNTLPPGCSTGPTGILNNEIENDAVSVYPNPFTNLVNIKLNEFQISNCEFRIYNVLGAEVMFTTVVKQVTTIETGNLPSGIYFYRVNANNKTIQTGKIIAQ
ncbi:MAG: ice-binding family protein [Bacteroidota bacterium]|nr:ice-binding family protein [Bacteroidota bacterium]